MKIRKIRESDISKLSLLHIQSLPDTVSSKIGKFYLECIYKSVIKNKKNCMSFIATDRNHITGIIVTTTNLLSFQSGVRKELFPAGYVQIFASLATQKFSLKEMVKRIKFENQLAKYYKDKYATFVILFTDVKYRKKGIATKLIREALKFYKSKVDNIYADTLKENIAAKKLYESIGFKLEKNISDSSLFLFQKCNG